MGVVRLWAGEKDTLKGLFSAPMSHQQILSGTFAELRPAHFHGGIDFKTQGVIGKQIHAPASGYISRISVAHGGYGKAGYITHDNGYTTVYGHIDQFATRVDSLIRTLQYKNQDYRATLDLPAEERLEGTLATTVLAAMRGCTFVRVHDVKENVRAIRMLDAIRNA